MSEKKNQAGSGNEALMRIRSRNFGTRNSNPDGTLQQDEFQKTGVINKTPIPNQREAAKDRSSKEEDKSERREVLSRLNGQDRSSVGTKQKVHLTSNFSMGLNSDFNDLSPKPAVKVTGKALQLA
jgi:hypothetical protein|tara:strand:+ start:174 stop:548 length:375 start_codon:yes stop_codon:yes gene_type:complete